MGVLLNHRPRVTSTSLHRKLSNSVSILFYFFTSTFGALSVSEKAAENSRANHTNIANIRILQKRSFCTLAQKSARFHPRFLLI